MSGSKPLRSQLTLSVIVPLYNEATNVGPMSNWISEALARYDGEFEIILVDDGSTDSTWTKILGATTNPSIRGIRLHHNVGQTAAMMAGFDYARGDVIVSLDGDLQNDPRDIPTLVTRLHEGYDLVCGWRRNRKDGFLFRKVPSWFANRLIRWLTGVPIRDNGCSLKAYRRELLDHLNLYADQHRFIPALAVSSGARIGEMPVRHHPRRSGESKYGLSRTLKVLADLLTLKMITTFRTRPLLGFGAAAMPWVVSAVVFAVMWFIAWSQFRPVKATAFVFPGAALLLLATALFLMMLGVMAEVALRAESRTSQRFPLVLDQIAT